MDLFSHAGLSERIKLRKYQTEAVDALYHYWSVGNIDDLDAGYIGNALLDLGTGLGKSLIIAEVVRTLIEDYPGSRVLMAVHIRELIEQNYKQLMALWPEAREITGVYSAGMGLREHGDRITYGGIQSIFDKPEIDEYDLLIVDEAHRIPKDGFGRYLTLIKRLKQSRPHMRIVGLTATPYRLDSGRLDQGRDRLFHQIVYSYGLGPGIADGWLSSLRSRSGVAAGQIDVSGVKKTGGEFNSGQLEAAALRTGVVQAACADIVRKAKGGEPIKPGSEIIEPARKSWLLFATGIDHAHAIAGELRRLGVNVATIFGDTPKAERDHVIGTFRRGELTALINVGVLTEGFDAPGVDLICLLRPTLSTGLYVQMVGRGVRKAPGKGDCLVLDYAGNVKRHGPVDDVRENIQGQVHARECPECHTLNKKTAKFCAHCGYEWPEPKTAEPRERTIKHEAKPEQEISILSGRTLPPGYEAPIDVKVSAWSCARWASRNAGSPDTLRVAYSANYKIYFEWVCFGHPKNSYPRNKAVDWWRQAITAGGALRGALTEERSRDCPTSIDEAIQRWSELTMPATIRVRKEGQYFKVVGKLFGAPVNPARGGALGFDPIGIAAPDDDGPEAA